MNMENVQNIEAVSSVGFSVTEKLNPDIGFGHQENLITDHNYDQSSAPAEVKHSDTEISGSKMNVPLTTDVTNNAISSKVEVMYGENNVEISSPVQNFTLRLDDDNGAENVIEDIINVNEESVTEIYETQPENVETALKSLHKISQSENSQNQATGEEITNDEGSRLSAPESSANQLLDEQMQENPIVNGSQTLNDKELLDILEGNDELDKSKDNNQASVSEVTEIGKHMNSEKKNILEDLPKSGQRHKRNLPKSKSYNKDLLQNIVEDWTDDETIDYKGSKVAEIKTKRNSHVEAVLTETVNNQKVDTPKRVSRVIKKKVMYDPDNPPTFTSPTKPKSDNDEAAPLKKGKADEIALTPKVQPKTPTQWKKPLKKLTPRDKKKKRISEVDRLLMDEGAVNMIYQLENNEGNTKKNMKSKADFIKKSVINSEASPTAVKVRERKPTKSPDAMGEKTGLPKSKIKGSKHGSSASVGEDFDVTDSIIYRRHSSSSYSSSCLSPRRLSDIESNKTEEILKKNTEDKSDRFSMIFKPETEDASPTMPPTFPIINKNSCKNMMQKLNSKLSRGLKRKMESPTAERIIKKMAIIPLTVIELAYNYPVATINIAKSTEKTCFDIAVLQELVSAFQQLEIDENVSIIVMQSSCGNLCSELSFGHPKKCESQNTSVTDILNAIRDLLAAINESKKLICTHVSGTCRETGVAIITLSDIVLLSAVAEIDLNITPQPGMTLISTNNFLKESVLLGRKLSAFEALEHGFVTKILDSANYALEIEAFMNELKQMQHLQIKKLLLKSSRKQPNEIDYDKEIKHLTEYWTSPEGMKYLTD